MQCWTREKKSGEKYVTCNSNTKKKPKKKLKIVRKRVIKPRKKKLKIIRRRVVKSKRELLEEARQKKNLEMARKPTPGFAEAIVMNNPMFRKAIFSNLSSDPIGDLSQGLTNKQDWKIKVQSDHISAPLYYYDGKIKEKDPKKRAEDIRNFKTFLRIQARKRAEGGKTRLSFPATHYFPGQTKWYNSPYRQREFYNENPSKLGFSAENIWESDIY